MSCRHGLAGIARLRERVVYYPARIYIRAGCPLRQAPSQFRQKWELRRVAFHRNGVCVDDDDDDVYYYIRWRL